MNPVSFFSGRGRIVFLLFAALFVTGLAVAGAQSAMVLPSVTVRDQTVNSSVVVQRVVSGGPGWIVIHADANGSPGPVIGYTAVKEGVNTNVKVRIDAAKTTPVLYAMLHVDAGEIGKYEFPGADVPVKTNGKMVSPAFKAGSESMY